ncbi:hypothetical protein VTO42DRAFT_3136 [Malbranchea cinnamomea]
MSLFGTSPDEASAGHGNSASRTKSSLFSDERHFGGGSSSSLFDDDVAGDSSPWSNPGPRRAARRELLKTMLPASDVPESYIDAYDAMLRSDDGTGTGVGITGVKKLLASTTLGPPEQSKILSMVAPEDQAATALERSEFNVLLALIGLAQEHGDLTFDAVDERRRRLPNPHIPYIEKLRSSSAANDTAAPSQSHIREPATPHSQRQRSTRRNTLEYPDSDPWASPVLHQGHDHSTENAPRLTANGFPSSVANGSPGRPAGGFRSHTETHTGEHGQEPLGDRPPGSLGSGWGDTYGSQGSGGFGSTVHSGLGGFGHHGDDQDHDRRNSLSRTLGGGRISTNGPEDVITINMLPEKEGIFMFQHRNYEVKSARRASSVIRRYSDFVWLVECLQKRYPFRQIPLLPPKRIAVNGTHLAADSAAFLEKRRRGLVRFANALVRHPVLSQEQLVIMFLTVPTELSVWRKQATLSVQEEFTNKALPPDLEESLPSNLEEIFETVRSGVKRSADIYINLCNLVDRLAKRNQGLAAEHFRVSRALQALTESTADTYAVDTNDVPLLNNGINSTAKHLIASQGLLEDEARAWDQGVLEDLKAQRDCLVAMRDLFDRRDKYAKDNIPQLERRIESNEKKLQDLRSRPEGTTKPGELEKIEDAILKDKESIVQQHARGVLIKECIRDELLIFQRSQYRISKLHQDWSQERVKYAELQADNWRALCEEVEAMPLSD